MCTDLLRKYAARGGAGNKSKRKYVFVSNMFVSNMMIRDIAMSKKVITFAHVGLYIKDIERSKQFYQDVLGFTCVCEFTNETGDKLAFMKSGDAVYELIQHKNWMDRKDGLFDHMAMQVDDIEQVSSELKAKGIVFEDEIYFDHNVFENGVKYQAFRGPDGEHLEIYQIM